MASDEARRARDEDGEAVGIQGRMPERFNELMILLMAAARFFGSAGRETSNWASRSTLSIFPSSSQAMKSPDSSVSYSQVIVPIPSSYVPCSREIRNVSDSSKPFARSAHKTPR